MNTNIIVFWQIWHLYEIEGLCKSKIFSGIPSRFESLDEAKAFLALLKTNPRKYIKGHIWSDSLDHFMIYKKTITTETEAAE
jgi:hypothetical protein